MKFSCIGGDLRQIETAKFLQEFGHDVTTFGLPKSVNICSADSLYNAVSGADAVVLPLPVTRDGNTINAPLTGIIISIQDILLCRPNFVFGGLIKQNLRNELSNHSIDFLDYYDSEALTVKNAVLTAEAAVAVAVNCTDFSIFGSKALVIGYGRIGRQLAKYLNVLGADVVATTRQDHIMACISADGITPEVTDNVTEICGEFDYIFNTVPFPLLDRNFFKNCKKTAFIEDLATDSGIDLAAAHEYEINAAVYGGLPGKHSPKTSAKFIAQEILKYFIDGGYNA